VLLDGNLPRAFAALLPGHRVHTVHGRRWSDLDDGPLLAARNTVPTLAPIAPLVLDALVAMEPGDFRVVGA
jgi:hypothetical protein